jgi:hypothetical protein
MPQPLLMAHPDNATIEKLKQVSRVGSNETATRCSAIQMLLAGVDRKLVCNALLVTNGTTGNRCICRPIRLTSTP